MADQADAVTLAEALSEWSTEDIAILGAVLELKQQAPTVQEIEDRLKWLFHSPTRAHVKSASKTLTARLTSLFGREGPSDTSVEDQYATPTYTELVVSLADELKVDEDDASLRDLEEFISHKVIVDAMSKMSPSERRKFFKETIVLAEVFDSAQIPQASVQGPMTTVAALGLAQASGMSVYLASTTALGFLTHAVGITLPFAVYTGLTSTIAFIIGPAGWLAAGGWLFWRLTGSEWQAIARAVMYIVSTNQRRELQTK